MEPDGDMEQLFIAPTRRRFGGAGREEGGREGREKNVYKAARGGEKNRREQHVTAGGNVDAGGVLLWSGIDLRILFKGALLLKCVGGATDRASQ